MPSTPPVDPKVRNQLLREAHARSGRNLTELYRLSMPELEAIANGGTTPPPKVVIKAEEATVPPPTMKAPPPTSGDPAAAALANMIKPYLDQKVDLEEVKAVVNTALAGHREEVLKEVDERVKDLVSTIKVEHFDGEIIEVKGAHKHFKKLLFYCGIRQNTYLYGPPGSGKSTGARMAADALKLNFGLSSFALDSPKSELAGVKDPISGNYRRTAFRECIEHGGIYLGDEIDNISPSLGIWLNNALARDETGKGVWVDFPDGKILRHKDFVFVASANTGGRGGDLLHQGRRPLDAATLDRFAKIEWGYDTALETAIVAGITKKPAAKAWMQWVRDVRKFVTEQGIPLVASPRASFLGAHIIESAPENLFTVEDIAAETIFGGIIKADVRGTIIRACPMPVLEGFKA